MTRHIAIISTATILTACHHASVGGYSPPDVIKDPPSRVARLSHATGSVSLRLSGVDEWVAAAVNRPLTSGDSIWTGADARAELNTGNAALRLDSVTRASLTEVGTSAVQVKVTEGTVSVRLRELDEHEEFVIDSPDATTTLLRAGQHRVEVSGATPGTTIIARSGMAQVAATGVSFSVRQNQQARVPGADSQGYTVTDARPTDSFDKFCAERDQREDRALAAKRVPPRLIGYEDLDEYGDWRTDASYGPVWAPRGVPVGWAPYRFGYWVWIDPWGWTWIDDAPWGFAPFHYGRWVFVGGHWGWVPGPYHRYPVYAPALVVFIGGGGPGLHVHYRVGGGLGVAWFPLGPREVWFPPYRTSRTYVTNVNITHTVVNNAANIHRVSVAQQRYVNRGVQDAVTAVPEDVFRRAGSIRRAAVRVAPRDAASASIGGSAPSVEPSRESRARGDRRLAPPPTERRQPAPARSRPDRTTAPPPRAQPPVETGRDREWGRRTTRDEAQRNSRADRERQEHQRGGGKDQRRK